MTSNVAPMMGVHDLLDVMREPANIIGLYSSVFILAESCALLCLCVLTLQRTQVCIRLHCQQQSYCNWVYGSVLAVGCTTIFVSTTDAVASMS